MPNHRTFWFLLCTLLLVPGGKLFGIILFEKGQVEPIVGRLIRHDGPKYTVRVESADGLDITREFFEAELESVLVTVSPERLASLSPHDPEAYRDYAEELAEKRKDPDARDTAKRLYLIAAYLAPETLGRSCLLGMAPLADNEPEERRFRAMAFLLDPRHDRKLLPAKGAAPPKTETDQEDGERILLKAIREFRRGNTRLARTLMDQDRIKAVMAKYEDIMTYDELYRAEYDTPPSTLYKILKLELRLARGPDAPAKQKTEATASWSEIAKQGVGDPVPTLTLGTLTSINPRACIFRDGKWIRPESVQP